MGKDGTLVHVLVLCFFAGHAGQAALAERPWCVGPSGCLAVLGLIGVWLELGLRPQTIASPDPINPVLLSHAQGIAQPAPLARLVRKSLQWSIINIPFQVQPCTSANFKSLSFSHYLCSIRTFTNAMIQCRLLQMLRPYGQRH